MKRRQGENELGITASKGGNAMFESLGDDIACRVSAPSSFTPPVAFVQGAKNDAPVSLTEAVDQLFKRFVEPAVRTKTKREYFQFFIKNCPNIFEALFGMTAMLKLTSSEEKTFKTAQMSFYALHQAIVNAAIDIAGAAEGENVDFAFSTYLSALEILTEIHGVPEGDATREAELKVEFSAFSAVFVFGIFSIWAAREAKTREGLVTPLEVVQGAVKYARDGALKAYAATREAVELRSRPEAAVHKFMEFDDEDARLAGL
jgi:hypothetical protein